MNPLCPLRLDFVSMSHMRSRTSKQLIEEFHYLSVLGTIVWDHLECMQTLKFEQILKQFAYNAHWSVVTQFVINSTHVTLSLVEDVFCTWSSYSPDANVIRAMYHTFTDLPVK